MSQPKPSSLGAHNARIVATPALLALAGLLTTASIPAQAGAYHDGWFVAGTFSYPAGGWPFSGSSGMFLVHPRNPGNPIPVAGLPPTLSGSTSGGIWSMTRRASDGALFVAELNTSRAGPANIHEIQLAGGAATIVATHVVGTSQDVTSCAALPGGTVLIGANGMIAGNMAGSQLGILNPATGGVTALPASMTGSVEAVAVDLTGTLAYVILSQGFSGPGALYEVPLPAGQSATLRATFPNRPRSLAVDNNGRIVVATQFLGGGVYVWDPATPSMAPTLLPGLPTGGKFAITVERATGNYVLSRGTGGNTMAAAWMTPTGPLNNLTTGPAGGWGTLRALVALDNPLVFGSQSTCVSGGDYAWRTAVNPGGIPLVGNTFFSITVEAPNPQPVCLFGFSWNRAIIPMPLPNCAQLLLDRTSLLPGLLVGSTPPRMTTFTLPFGIPNSAGLAGLSVFAQSFHLVGTNPNIIESSPGIRLTIL